MTLGTAKAGSANSPGRMIGSATWRERRTYTVRMATDTTNSASTHSVGASRRCDSTIDSSTVLMEAAMSTPPSASKGRGLGLGDGRNPDSARAESAIGTRTQ